MPLPTEQRVTNQGGDTWHGYPKGDAVDSDPLVRADLRSLSLEAISILT